MSTFYGKYRGKVLNNLDPQQRGRLIVQVPGVLGDNPSSWALPCFPFGGKQSGLWCIPQVNSGVWVEFEGGDSNYPIWTGSWFGSSSEVPSLAKTGNPVSPSVVIATGGKQTLMLSDLPGPTGGILLKTATGAKIAINDIGITISNGKGASITLTGTTVAVNKTALTVT